MFHNMLIFHFISKVVLYNLSVTVLSVNKNNCANQIFDKIPPAASPIHIEKKTELSPQNHKRMILNNYFVQQCNRGGSFLQHSYLVFFYLTKQRSRKEQQFLAKPCFSSTANKKKPSTVPRVFYHNVTVHVRSQLWLVKFEIIVQYMKFFF